MKYGLEYAQMVETNRIFLNLKNKRHEQFDSQEQVIAHLCQGQYVLALAKDIVKHGLNQLELFALIPVYTIEKISVSNFVVAEGNRRMCALKLLADPDLAPADKRSDFQRLAKDWKPIPKVFSAVFEKHKDVELWITRLHGGLQDGIGRKPWDAGKKNRQSDKPTYKVAQSIVDYAEAAGIIPKEYSDRKLSTVQRYLGNPLMRDAIGIKSATAKGITITRSDKDFNFLLKEFFTYLDNDIAHSRQSKNDIDAYSHKLRITKGLSVMLSEPRSVTGDCNSTEGKKRRRSTKPKPLEYIDHDKCLNAALKDIPSHKLENIYYSLCSIELKDHTPLLSVGMWSFLETLTACSGRTECGFLHYLTGDRLNKLDLGDRYHIKGLRDAIRRISDYGNTTKHHEKCATFDSTQLATDVDSLNVMMIKLAQKAKEENDQR